MTQVHGHPLPDALVTAIDDGDWLQADLSAIGTALGVSFDNEVPLSPGVMEDTILEHLSRAEFGRADGQGGLFDTYGFEASSVVKTSVELPRLDLDKAVPLIICDGYKEVWLDYRTDPPRVVAGLPNVDGAEPANLGRHWVVASPDFETFALSVLP